jgi:hypothetical protein
LLEEFTKGESQEELIRRGFEISGVKDMITYEEFEEKGYFIIPTSPDWVKRPPGLIEFLY